MAESPSLNGDTIRVVVIGGGTGIGPVIRGLSQIGGIQLTVICTSFDTGGETGEHKKDDEHILRDSRGFLPQGDFRRAFVALAEGSGDDTLRKLFLHRFSSGRLQGFTVGGVMMKGIQELAQEYHWDFKEQLDRLHTLFRIEPGRVVPVSLHHAELEARLSDGSVLQGESAIDTRDPFESRFIVDMRLDPPAFIYKEAEEAILNAHYVLIGPGDIITSSLANLLVEGVSNALAHSRARVCLIVNLMNKASEAPDFVAADYPEMLLKRFTTQDGSSVIGRGYFDAVFVNTGQIPEHLIEKYENESRSTPVLWKDPVTQVRLSRVARKVVFGDFLDIAGDLIRHNEAALTYAIRRYIHENKARGKTQYYIDLDHTVARTVDLAESTENLERLKCAENAMDFFECVKGRVHIVTAGKREIQEKKIDILGLRPFLAQEGGVYIVEKPEQKVGIFIDAQAQLIRKNARGVVIGDRVASDIKAGKLSGLFTVRMRHPDGKYAHEEPDPHDELTHPHRVVSNFEELMLLLPELE